MFYEALKDVTEYGKQRWISGPNWDVNSSLEGLVLGGLAGGMLFAFHSLSKLFRINNLWFQIFIQVSVHISLLPWMSLKQDCKCRVQL